MTSRQGYMPIRWMKYSELFLWMKLLQIKCIWMSWWTSKYIVANPRLGYEGTSTSPATGTQTQLLDLRTQKLYFTPVVLSHRIPVSSSSPLRRESSKYLVNHLASLNFLDRFLDGTCAQSWWLVFCLSSLLFNNLLRTFYMKLRMFIMSSVNVALAKTSRLRVLVTGRH